MRSNRRNTFKETMVKIEKLKKLHPEEYKVMQEKSNKSLKLLEETLKQL